jgi:hypothetical protein
MGASPPMVTAPILTGIERRRALALSLDFAGLEASFAMVEIKQI